LDFNPKANGMSKVKTYLPVATPQLGQHEMDYVNEALGAGAISGNAGLFLERFEKGFASYCACAHGIATSSGTTALHLVLAALGIGPGDEVLVSTLTNMATFFAVLYQGATPVPVDIEPDTWNLDPRLLGDLITPRTKAVLVVHLYGHPADMDPILDVARAHSLYVIEDAAEAHGALYKGRKVGSLGHVGCFSFYSNKILTTGEGGMMTTNDPAIAERARSLRNLAYGVKEKFMHAGVGFNYRMTNLQAALGCAQLEKIEDVIEGKRRVARRYSELLANLEHIRLPVEKPYAKNVYWMYHVVLEDSLAHLREAVMAKLQEWGIETRPCFVPYNLQQIFIDQGKTQPELCPVANRIAQGGFYLPSSPDLSDEDIRYVATHLIEVTQKLES
jgi:perosamine synthetase